MVKFSIIVPCYNLENWIRDCLDSVLEQSVGDWECIVVDDESTDGSPAVLDEYAAKDSRIKVIHQKNAGEGGARNAGLAVAKGEWVFFLDGDDVMAPGALERLAKIIDRHPNEDLIRFGFENFEDGEDLKCVGNRCVKSGLDRVVDISRRIEFGDYFVYVWQFIFRRTMIAEMKFDRYKRGADRTFIIPVLCYKVNSFVATDEVCYLYRKRPGSAMAAKASVQVLKDELSHRLDVIGTIDRCGKAVCYRGTCWLEGYCLGAYLKLAESSGEYSSGEQRELIDWFYRELPRIYHARGFSVMGRIRAQLYRVLCCRGGRHLIASIMPMCCHRLYLLFNPLALVRSVRKRMSRA